jgi:hypothetical protein
MKATFRAAAIAVGVTVLVTATAGTASADTAVRVTVPSGSTSLYVYQGPGPEGDSTWNHCFALNGTAGVKTPSVPATAGQGQWNFYAYAEAGCPLDAGPLARATNVTAPRDLGSWSITLR